MAAAFEASVASLLLGHGDHAFRTAGPARRCAANASALLRALRMKSTSWRAINLTAIQGMANAHELLTILGTAALPARADSPGASLRFWIA